PGGARVRLSRARGLAPEAREGTVWLLRVRACGRRRSGAPGPCARGRAQGDGERRCLAPAGERRRRERDRGHRGAPGPPRRGVPPGRGSSARPPPGGATWQLDPRGGEPEAREGRPAFWVGGRGVVSHSPEQAPPLVAG